MFLLKVSIQNKQITTTTINIRKQDCNTTPHEQGQSIFGWKYVTLCIKNPKKISRGLACSHN